VVASQAGEMISEISLAMASGIGLRTLARVNHPYPTQAPAIKMAADAYNSTRMTPVLRWIFTRWLPRRGESGVDAQARARCRGTCVCFTSV